MNKTELLNKADELIKKANELKELANDQDYTLVPDEIKITKMDEGFSKGMWIINFDKELCYNTFYQDWNVLIWNRRWKALIRWKLTPCGYEDLEPWDVFYRSDEEDEDFGSPHKYAIKLDDWSYQYWEGDNCINGSTNWNYYWKVEPI